MKLESVISVRTIVILAFSASALAHAQDVPAQRLQGGGGSWRSAGQNLGNTRSQPNERIINAGNVKDLQVKWIFTTGGDVSATPTVDRDAVYAPDWVGNLFAVQKETGKEIWHHQISEYDGISGAMSRVSPLVVGDEVVIGDNVINQRTQHSGASVVAVDRASGTLKWATRVEEHPAAVITGYDCCTFRGSIVALNAQTGKILWKTYTVPDNHGTANAYSGGAIWQSPAIEPARGLLYVGTGNNYTVPAGVEAAKQWRWKIRTLTPMPALRQMIILIV